MPADKVPFYYEPRPYQRRAWARRLSGKYDYYFKIWHRQAGKDSDDIQYALYNSWMNPGTQSAYVGLDNKWVRRNIWDKYLDGRHHWDSYPEEYTEVEKTNQQIKFSNNPDELAPAIIQFIGFKESETLLGSSYDNFYVSELSLYKPGAFDLLQPIWDTKVAEGAPLSVNFNFTPRGLSNVAADMLRAYTGEEDPQSWPGEHGRVYVDVMRADESLREDGTRLFTDEHLESIRARYIRALGNDNLFRQEYLCDFLTVNAGLVFQGIEVLREEKRDAAFNLRSDKPVYVAWDISSKDKQSDWTAAVVFQYYDGQTFIYDWYENNRKAVVECVQELAQRDYFHLIRMGCLPWDSDRSGSMSSPLVEVRQTFPNITWTKLDRSYQNDGINRVRKLLPNLHINGGKCAWLLECFENYEYKELTGLEDWAATPKHDRYSHLMDAVRYMADMIEQMPTIRGSSGVRDMPSHYRRWDEDEEDPYAGMPPGMRPSKLSPKRKKKPGSTPNYSNDWW